VQRKITESKIRCFAETVLAENFADDNFADNMERPPALNFVRVPFTAGARLFKESISMSVSAKSSAEPIERMP
jgi:hypothetical protein